MVLTLLTAAVMPAAALAQSSAESKTFTADILQPEGLKGQTEINVLSGTMVQLVASYDGRVTPPTGTQFCWQYSTAGTEGSYKFLTSSATDISHISYNSVQITASAGATWYRAVLETPEHEPAETYTPSVSTAVAVTGSDFLFTSPIETPEVLRALPGASLTLGPVKAEAVRGTPVTYQWQEAAEGSWVDIAGTAGASLETGPLTAGTHRYRCQALAVLGTDAASPSVITSPIYTVEVEPLAIAGYSLRVDGETADLPQDGTAALDTGSTASLTVELTDPSEPVRCQWQWAAAEGSWRDLRAEDGVWGIESRTLSVPMSDETGGRRYRCCITAAGAVLGNGPDDPVVTLNLTDPGQAYARITPSPFISCSLAAGTEIAAPAGMPVVFTAVNRSTPEIPAAYLAWQWEGASAPGGPFAPLTDGANSTYIARPNPDMPLFLRCRAVNTASGGTLEAVSNTLRLTAAQADGTVYFTEPLTPPAPVEVRPGESWTFTGHAQTDDGSPVAYTWQYAAVASADTPVEEVPDTVWTDIAGAENAVYTAEDLRAGFYFYRCLAANLEDPGRQASSAAWKVCVLPYSAKPVVEPSATVVGPSGEEEPRNIAIGVAAGGRVVLQVEASVPSGDRMDYTWYREPLGPGQLPQLFPDEHEPVLVLEDVPAMYDACRFYCIVSNRAHRDEQTHSAAWYLSVWQQSKVPEIISQPRDVSASWSPGSPAEELSVSVTARRSTGVVLEKEQTDGSWALSEAFELKSAAADGTEESEAPSQTYTGTFELSAQAYDLNGTYRVRADNGTAVRPLLPPCTWSEPFTVSLEISGQPQIEKQPVPAQAAVGQKAEFAISASVQPADVDLTYCWQVSEDAGHTYRNCLPADGTASGAAFETVTLTEADARRDPALLFRCIAANAATGQMTQSSPARLTVLAAEPSPPPVDGDLQISVRPGSGLTAADGLLSGLTVTRAGITASALLADLSAPDGYHVRLMAADGTPLKAESPVGTGTLAELVSDLDDDEIPVSLTVIVQGDVTGSGRLSIVQLTTLAKALNGQNPLDGAYFRAGDFNGDGTINVSDLVSEARLLN